MQRVILIVILAVILGCSHLKIKDTSTSLAYQQDRNILITPGEVQRFTYQVRMGTTPTMKLELQFYLDAVGKFLVDNQDMIVETTVLAEDSNSPYYNNNVESISDGVVRYIMSKGVSRKRISDRISSPNYITSGNRSLSEVSVEIKVTKETD